MGNHIHLHIQLKDLHGYNPFIRAITAAIAMAVSGVSRWKKSTGPFWDLRPFTHIVATKVGLQRLSRYMKINELEPLFGRLRAEEIVGKFKPA